MEEQAKAVTAQNQELKPRRNVYDPDFAAFLQEKGLIDVVRQEEQVTGAQAMPPGQAGPGAPITETVDVPVDVRDGMRKDYALFLKDRGWSILNEPLPTREEADAALARSTAQLREIYMDRAGATISATSRESVERSPAVSPAETAQTAGQPTIGAPRPTERKAPLADAFQQKLSRETGFWKQVGDSMSLLKKGKFREAEQLFVDAAVSGVTMGIIRPSDLDKVTELWDQKVAKGKYKTGPELRQSIIDTLGYYPEKAGAPVSFVFQVLPISKIAKAAKALGAAATTIPALQRLFTAVAAGTMTGTTEIAGEAIHGKKFDYREDLKKIPTHMLYWGLFEFGALGVETAAKIVNWNLKYGPKSGGFWQRMRTGKYGGYGAAQGINIETQYAPGRGPTTKTEFTGEEIRNLFRKFDAAEGAWENHAQTMGWSQHEAATRRASEFNEWAKQTRGIQDWEIEVREAIRESNGWAQATRRGWIPRQPVQVPGEPPVISGYRVTRTGTVPPSVGGQEIPMKPAAGDVLRPGGARRPWPTPEVAPGAPTATATAAAPPPPGVGPQVPPQAQPGPVGAESQAPPGAAPPGSAPPAVSGAPRARQQAPPPPPPRQAPPPPPRAQQAPPPPPPATEKPPITTPPPKAETPPGEKPPIVPPIESRLPTFEDKIFKGGVEYGEIAGIGETIIKIRPKSGGKLEYVSQEDFNKGDYSIDPMKKVGIRLEKITDEAWPPKGWTPGVEGEVEPRDHEVTFAEFERNPLVRDWDPERVKEEYYDALGEAIREGQYIPVEVLDQENEWVKEFLDNEDNWTEIDRRGREYGGEARREDMARPVINYYDRKGLGTKPKYLEPEDLGSGKFQPKEPPAKKAKKPKIKVTPQDDGSFTIETEEPPAPEPGAPPAEATKGTWRDESLPMEERVRLAKEAAGKANVERMDIEFETEEGDVMPSDDVARVNKLQAEEEAADEFVRVAQSATKPAGKAQIPRTDTRLREAIDRIQAGEGTAEDMDALSFAAKRNERLKKLADAYKARSEAAKVDILTGVGSDLALNKIKGWKNRAQIRMDLAGVSQANNDPSKGHDWVDEHIFKPAGEVLREFDVDPYRKGGTADEFVLLGKKNQTIGSLQKIADSIQRTLERMSIGSYMGVGRNGADAERFMTENKARVKGEGARPKAEPEPPKREAPEDKARRIFKSRREAQSKRGRVGVPKDAPQIVRDILDVTQNKGISPITTATGKVSEEYRSIPKYLKSKNGLPIDEVEDLLARTKNYRYGKGATKSLLDDLQDLYFAEANYNPKDVERDAEDWKDIAEEYQRKIDERSATAEGAGLKSKEEAYHDFIKRMTEDAEDAGLSEDEAWSYVEARIQAQRAYEDKYRPIMNEGETWPAFLSRMEADAIEVGMEPEESLIYADRMLKRKAGSSEPSGGKRFLISPKIKETPGSEPGKAWFSGLKDKSGKAIVVMDPAPNIIAGHGTGSSTETYSNQAQDLEYDEFAVKDVPEWRLTLDHWLRGDDPKFNDFLDTIKKIFAETDGYGRGVGRNIPYIPPIAMKVAIEKRFTGHKGVRVFQLEWILAHDFVARLFQKAVGSPPFLGTNVLHLNRFPKGHPLEGRTVGGFIRPSTGELFINPNYLDARIFDRPWAVAMHIRDVVLHELNHFWILDHNEEFTSHVKLLGSQTDHLMPYVVRLAEKITGQSAEIDRGKTFIALGPGRGAEVPNAIINLAGNETAKLIAESKEQKDGKLYKAKRGAAEVPGGERGRTGGGEPGEPGPSGNARAGRGAQLPYPRRDAQARPEGMGVRPGRPVGEWQPPLKGEPAPGEEFALTPTEEAPPPFKPEGLEGRQGVLPMEGGGDLFSKKLDDKFLILVKTNEGRPKRPQPRPLPPQPHILEEGEFPAVRTDDGGIYFDPQNRYPFHSQLVAGLRIPPERVVAGGFIKDGVYIESSWSEAGRIGREGREAMGLPRELYMISGKEADRILPEVKRLTSGRFSPKAWVGNTRQEIEDNQQNLARYILENYKPEDGPLENYINKMKQFFYRGGRSRNVEGPRQEMQPIAGAPEFQEGASVFSPESQPKNKPQPEPEIPGETMKKDVFGSEEIRVLNAIRRAGQGYAKKIGATGATEDKIVEVLKSRILPSIPESYSSIAARIGVSKRTAQNYYENALELMANDPAVLEVLDRRMMKYAHAGLGVSPEDMRRLAKMIRKYFSSYRGADKVIDAQNDQRIGEKMAELFQATLDVGVIKDWLEDQPAAVNAYATDLMTGALTGDAYSDIFNSHAPFKVKEAMLTLRARIDRLSDTIILHGGLTPETKAAFEANLGKYLTKAYRLWEYKRWDPPESARAPFRQFLQNQYHMTEDQANDFIEAELSYGRNDEGIRPRRSRRTRRVPTDHYIHRKQLTPEWRAFAGEIDRLPWLLLNTITKQASMAYNAKFLDWISGYLPDHWVATYEEAAQKGWQNSRFPEHSYAYGKLAGKWVDPELFRYVKSEFDTNRSDIEEAIQQFLMNPFKWTKTIGSIPSQVRNPLSNIGLSLLGRNTLVNPLNLKWYVQSLAAHANRTGSARDLWDEMIRKGVTGTQYYGEEIPKIQKGIMRFEDETWLTDLWDNVIKWPIDKLGEAYNAGDSLFRVSQYLHDTRGRGMTPEKAVEELNASLQNYRKLPVVVDILRRWPVLGPFISFKANVITIVGRQAKMGAEEMANPGTRMRGVARFLRLALFLSIPKILSEVSKRVNDVDEEEIKKLEAYYPPYRRGGTFIYFRGREGQLKVFDLSFIWPTGDVERMVRSLANGDIEGLKDATDFFSHPLFDIWSILIKGQDPQWGTKYRGVVEQAKAAAAYLYLPASMPIPNLEGLLHGDVRPGGLTGPQIKKIIDAYNQQPDKYGRVPKLTEEIKNFFSGIRTWDVDPEKLLIQSVTSRAAEIEELKREHVSWIVKNSKAPEWEREKKTAAFKERIEKLGQELKEIGKLRKELKAGGFKLTRY